MLQTMTVKCTQQEGKLLAIGACNLFFSLPEITAFDDYHLQ